MTNSPLDLVVTSNDGRSEHLFRALGRIADVAPPCEFDHIDVFTKYAAALLSYDRPRSEWWENYQLHPLIQRRRRRVLQRSVDGAEVRRADALLMWGSWFRPDLRVAGRMVPFFNYIDQSRSLAPLPGEPPAAILHRERSHRLQAETYAASSGVFCMSEWARNQTLDAHTLPPSKVHAVGWGPCAVDLSTEPLEAHEREPVVLHVSNDFPRKGVDHLVATAERLQDEFPQVRFVVVGQGNPQPAWRTVRNVSFVGPMRGADLERQFRNAALFFLPHRFDRSPHVLVEAMSARLPIVASGQGGALELINGQDTGFSVPVGDIDGYAAAIRVLLGNEEVRRRMVANGHQLMRRRYNWDAVARTIVQHMATILASQSGTVG